ncbi:MAG: asparagine synthase-related protein, partial [Bryobacteraceae bacterium]
LPAVYDEPFADSSQIPTFLVSQMARRHVTVALSGDGGDELFAGYTHYAWSNRIRQLTGWMPKAAQHAASRLLSTVPAKWWDRIFGQLDLLWQPRSVRRNPGYKLHKLADLLMASGPEDAYRVLLSQWKNPASMVLGAHEPPILPSDPELWEQCEDFIERLMYLDTITYLPDDILVKMDRASMSVGLEARVPLLDHRLIEFAWRIPQSMRMRAGQGKWLLRQVLYRYVPKALIERPKMGFAIPIHDWLRGPLRPWAEDLLNERRLRDEGFFDPQPIRAKWAEHLSGSHNWQCCLWNILMFQAWFAESKKMRTAEIGVLVSA